jgi:hypothetical protein
MSLSTSGMVLGWDRRIRGAFTEALAVSVVMVWLGSGAGAAYGAYSESRICSVYRCATLVAGTKVRVFKATERHEQQESSSITFAQWLPTGRLDFLTNSDPLERGVSHFVIAGRYLAFADATVEPDIEGEFAETTVLLNVETGRERLMPGWSFTVPSRGVVQVALTPSGSLAWMIEGLFGNPTVETSTGPLPGRAVYALRAGAKEPALLSYSENIVPISLAATSGHIYWLETSGPRTYAAP